MVSGLQRVFGAMVLWGFASFSVLHGSADIEHTRAFLTRKFNTSTFLKGVARILVGVGVAVAAPAQDKPQAALGIAASMLEMAAELQDEAEKYRRERRQQEALKQKQEILEQLKKIEQEERLLSQRATLRLAEAFADVHTLVGERGYAYYPKHTQAVLSRFGKEMSRADKVKALAALLGKREKRKQILKQFFSILRIQLGNEVSLLVQELAKNNLEKQGSSEEIRGDFLNEVHRPAVEQVGDLLVRTMIPDKLELLLNDQMKAVTEALEMFFEQELSSQDDAAVGKDGELLRLTEWHGVAPVIAPEPFRLPS